MHPTVEGVGLDSVNRVRRIAPRRWVSWTMSDVQCALNAHAETSLYNVALKVRFTLPNRVHLGPSITELRMHSQLAPPQISNVDRLLRSCDPLPISAAAHSPDSDRLTSVHR